jgi:hypothetical protein
MAILLPTVKDDLLVAVNTNLRQCQQALNQAETDKNRSSRYDAGRRGGPSNTTMRTYHEGKKVAWVKLLENLQAQVVKVQNEIAKQDTAMENV